MENDISVEQESLTQTQASPEQTTRLDESIQDPLSRLSTPKLDSGQDDPPDDAPDRTSSSADTSTSSGGTPDDVPDDTVVDTSDPEVPQLDDRSIDTDKLIAREPSEEAPTTTDDVGDDTEPRTPTPEVTRVGGLTLSPDLFQIDPSSVGGPETFLKDDGAWRAYQSGEMSGETRKRYEGDLARARREVDGIVLSANTSLTSEKTSREKTEADTRAQLSADQEAAGQDKETQSAQAEAEKTRKTREATAAANKEHYAAEAKAEQDKAAAKGQTQADISAERTRTDAQKSAKKRDADARARQVRADAEAEKQRQIAQAEKEEQEKYWYEKAWDYVASAWERIKDSVTAMISKAWDYAKSIVAAADQAIRDIASSFSGWVSRQWAAFEATCAEISTNLQAFLSNTWAAAKQQWATFKAEMSQRLTEIGQQFKETMSKLAQDAQQAIDSSMAYLQERGTAIVTSVTTSISSAYDDVSVLWNRYDGEELAPDKELFLTPQGRADWLYKAVRGVGADSTMVLRCLRGSVEENKQLAAHLKKEYGLVLVDVLKSELGGAELAMAIDLVEGGTVKLHNKIRRAIDGWGADTEAVIKLVESPSTSNEERYQLLHDPRAPKDVLAVRERLIGEIGWAAFNRLKKGVSSGEDGGAAGEVVQTPEALYARLQQRGNGAGTDEAGMYTDLQAFSKKYPEDARLIGEALLKIARGEPYTSPGGTSAKILGILSAELGGRDLDKAVAALMGGGAKQAIAALGEQSTDDPKKIEAAITELFRPILLTMDSEDYRWYTDEDRINADLAAHWQAVNELKTAVGDEMFDTIRKHPKYVENDKKVRAVMKSELNAAELAKATAMMEHGKQSNIDKLREEVETMIITDRSCLDAIIAMDATERQALAKDTALLAKIQAGVTLVNYARIKDILGISTEGKGDGAANAARLASVIIDAVDGSDKLDQAYDAVLEAQFLVAAEKLDMAALNTAVRARNGLFYMPKTDPAYRPLWDALEGKKTLTSGDRLRAATDGAGTDETGIKETIKDLRGKDLLENWTNIADYRAILKGIEDATKAGDTAAAEAGQIQKKQFILSISATADAVLRSELGGKDYTETRKALMDKIKEASTKDPVFIQEVQAAGLTIDKLYHEKMEYMQSVLEKDVHYEEGMNLVDDFTTKDEQLQDAHGDYMGTLRTGMQELEQNKEGVTQESVIKATDEKQAYFQDRLKAYRDMKSAVANTVALVLSTVVAVVLTIVTGGLGAGVAGAILSGMIAGAGGAAAGAIAKEAIMGGDYDFWSQGVTEVLVGGLSGAVAGGVGKALGGVQAIGNFAKSAGTKVTNQLGAFGGKVSGYIGKGVAEAIPKMPESLLTNAAMEPVNQMLGSEGFLRLGWDGVIDQVAPAVVGNATKETVVSFFTGGIKIARSGDDFTDDIMRASDDEVGDMLSKQTSKQFVDNVVEGTVGSGYDVAASEGRKELTVTDGLTILSDASKGTAKNYTENRTTVHDSRVTVVDEDVTVTTTTDPVEDGKTFDPSQAAKKEKVLDTEQNTVKEQVELGDDGLPIVKTGDEDELVQTFSRLGRSDDEVDTDEDTKKPKLLGEELFDDEQVSGKKLDTTRTAPKTTGSEDEDVGGGVDKMPRVEGARKTLGWSKRAGVSEDQQPHLSFITDGLKTMPPELKTRLDGFVNQELSLRKKIGSVEARLSKTYEEHGHGLSLLEANMSKPDIVKIIGEDGYTQAIQAQNTIKQLSSSFDQLDAELGALILKSRQEGAAVMAEVIKLAKLGPDATADDIAANKAQAQEKASKLAVDQSAIDVLRDAFVSGRFDEQTMQRLTKLNGRGKQPQDIDDAVLEAFLRDKAAAFYELTDLGPRPETLKLTFTGKRATYNHETGEVNIGLPGKTFQDILIHELTHGIEHANQDISAASKSFVEARAENSGNGSKLQDINSKGEQGLVGDFVSDYVGRVYNSAATEVLTMSMQNLSNPALLFELYRKDPEHFYFMLGVVSK